MTKYANRKRIKGPTLKGGDKVYLLRRNIKSNKLTKKLDVVKLGPFKILRQKGLVNYELELPKRMRILPTFHVSLLEPATPDSALEQDVRDISEEIHPARENCARSETIPRAMGRLRLVGRLLGTYREFQFVSTDRRVLSTPADNSRA
jgi:hypothetical protein